MEKKYFLIIPLFFLLFSFLFPVSGGVDRLLVRDTDSPGHIKSALNTSDVPYFPGRECTCCFRNGSFSAAGFLDGTVLVGEDNSPYKVLDNRTSGKFQTVYAIAASEGAEYLAILSGLYPRSLSVYQKKQDTYNLIHRVELQYSARKSTYLAFSGNMLLYEDTAGISALSLVAFNKSTLAFKGTLEKVDLDPEQKYVWVYFSNDEKNYIHIFLYDGSLVAAAPFEEEGLLLARLVER